MTKPFPAIDDELRIYAVGDVHGRVDLLDGLLSLIEDDARGAPEPEKLIIFLGDLVDRGLHSPEVVDLVLSDRPTGLKKLCLKGNHEAALLDFLKDPSSGPSWCSYGGLETLYSYGVHDLPDIKDVQGNIAARDVFAKNLPPEHLSFFEGLPLSMTVGDYFFVHAGVRPGIPLNAQKEEDLIWIRSRFLDSDQDFGKVVVHGHTISPRPEVRDNRIGIDTGAFATEVLTALVLYGDQQKFLHTNPDQLGQEISVY